MEWHVVVADDDAQILDLLCTLLAIEPDFVVAGRARDGLEAIAMVASRPPDLVLLDCHMPGIDGFEALPEIRRRAPQAVVVMMSGSGSAEMEALALAAGADSFYPITPSLALNLTDDLRDLMCATDSALGRSTSPG